MCRKRNWRAKKTGSFRAGAKETSGKTSLDTNKIEREKDSLTKEIFAGAEATTGSSQRGRWPELQDNPRDHLLGSSGNSLDPVENAKKIDSIKLSYYSIMVYIHICTKYFVNKFSTSWPEIIVAFGKFYKKCFPPRAKTSFCLSNQKPRVNILEPRHLIVNWAQFFSNVCSFYLFSDIIMELFILQFISSWLFKIDSWLILVREWKYLYLTMIIKLKWKYW